MSLAALPIPIKLVLVRCCSLSSAPASSAPADQPHDFDAQKHVHQKIRNDADYDDWEYGTEPLPHEAWNGESQASPSGESSA